MNRISKTIILLDDDELSAYLLNQTLLKNGYEVEVLYFNSAESFLANYPSFTYPPIYFLDINLKGMNGMDLLTKIKELNEMNNISNTHIYALSADISQKTKNDALKHGFTDYFLKPINIDSLLPLIS